MLLLIRPYLIVNNIINKKTQLEEMPVYIEMLNYSNISTTIDLHPSPMPDIQPSPPPATKVVIPTTINSKPSPLPATQPSPLPSTQPSPPPSTQRRKLLRGHKRRYFPITTFNSKGKLSRCKINTV